jgi:5-methylcytosine-specific restriction protein A
MPYAAPRVCSEPGCHRAQHAARCDQHQRTDVRSGQRAAQYAGRPWQLIRKAVLRRDPMCSECGERPSTTAAHVVPRSKGGSDSLLNLRGLCTSCHSRETAARDGGFGNPTRGAA